MDKTLRCTVCTWRGAWAEAAAVRVQAAPLPPALEEIQRAYAEKAAEDEALGGHRTPNCPNCGNHLLHVHMHRSHAAM
ncbi:MAG TPA: hypothetical protein VII82_12380 [Polyangiaceae bacterium]|jgi:hypothetical protein